jgi:hypothetical protein
MSAEDLGREYDRQYHERVYGRPLHRTVAPIDLVLNHPHTTTTATTTATPTPTPSPSTTPPSMPSQPRASRLPNGYVDLTAPDSPPRRRRRSTPGPGPSAKRQKRDDGSSASKSPVAADEVDLTGEADSSVDAVLRKQREDAVKAQTQAQHDEKPTTFSTLTCVICMDTPTDLTATACGEMALMSD